ncbi:MAG: TetR family transcriptional regulator C-terminal domain-containing protein [Rhodobacteraceae bacterium]|nr:TetR family transcriptional regulator C-terminal domain-containing protein [Paracoccaceae bacterium]
MDKQLSPTSQRMQRRIIDAVVETVAGSGLSGTTLALIARNAGVSQGVVVFHFKTKDALLAETLHRLSGEYHAIWQQALCAPDPLDRVTGLVRADFSPEICTPKKLALWFAFWGEAGAEPLYNAICARSEQIRYEAMAGACADLVARHGGPNPALLAETIDAMTDGLWLQMHIYGTRVRRAAALETALAHLRLLLPGLAARI